MNAITLIIPTYNQNKMLRKQLDTAREYPDSVPVIVVDDHSIPPAEEVFTSEDRAELYRVDVDVPWNRSMARNLGADRAITEWLIHVDTDHVLPANALRTLLWLKLNPKCWYRFPRFRVGKADETRRKDQIPDDVEFGRIHPHVDSYLIPRAMYWATGGYDPDYAGCLGGGGAFLARLEQMFGPSSELPVEAALHVYTRSVIPDSSVFGISRDTSEYKRRRREKEARGDVVPRDPIRYPWHRVR